MDFDNLAFNADLLNIIPTIVDSDDMVVSYNSKLKYLIDRHAPIKSRSLTSRPSALWMSLEIKQAKAERRQAERKWLKEKPTIYRQLFCSCKLKVKALIASAKQMYFKTKITESVSSKALFTITNAMSGKAHTVILPAPFPVNELPDRFGAFFQEKVNKIRASIDCCKTDRSPQHEPFLKTPLKLLNQYLKKK
ncbi:ATP-dependent DNA helicase [Elysia marginata]|uniref:ATP-dependent DNA helicase n=1 Tax=Elysia marginata TaxID=1093978 RepID=A0AAV4IIC3_9GAST|nr:ATP-dependent DNA helicase [Elysia marginata]